MNKILLPLFILVLISLGIFYYKIGTIAPATEVSVVTFPAGGEALVRGKAYQLTWTGGPDPIEIFLIDRSLKTEGVSVSISDRVYGIKNEHVYTYTVPLITKPGEYEFQIGTAVSNPFTIVAE